MKIAKILRWYDRDGKYIGPEDRMVHTKEGTYPLQEYADMEQSHHQGHTEEYGDGDSKSKE